MSSPDIPAWDWNRSCREQREILSQNAAVQTQDTGCGFSREPHPGQLSIHRGPLPAQRRGSHKAPHMLALSFRGPLGCRGHAKGGGSPTQLFPFFKWGEQSGQYAGLVPLAASAGENGTSAFPKPAFRPRTALQSGSVAHFGEKDGAVPQKIPGPETSLIKEKGQEARNSPYPALTGRLHSLSLPHSASFL